MKWKMAENSLFAILLRSPWWISLGIGVALALLMRVLLPPEYAAPAMLGSFPFLVIAAMAAWKQLRAPSAAQVEQTLQRLQAMNSRDFIAALEAAFRAEGHEVRRLLRSTARGAPQARSPPGEVRPVRFSLARGESNAGRERMRTGRHRPLRSMVRRARRRRSPSVGLTPVQSSRGRSACVTSPGGSTAISTAGWRVIATCTCPVGVGAIASPACRKQPEVRSSTAAETGRATRDSVRRMGELRLSSASLAADGADTRRS